MCDGTMWVTVDLLVGREKKRTDKDLLEEVQEWLDNVLARIAECNAADDSGTSVGIPDLPLTASKKKNWKLEEECSFGHPCLQSRLERLMGSNVVRITDRAYMQRLQSRIREDHEDCVRKRIRDREVEEIERERQLILEGRMAIEDAPEELSTHPVFQITQLTSKILQQKRRKVGIKKNRKSADSVSYSILRDLMVEDNLIDPSESGIGLTLQLEDHEEQIAEEQDSLSNSRSEPLKVIKYEAPLVKELRKLETIEELYKLAELIVGPVVISPFSQRRQCL